MRNGLIGLLTLSLSVLPMNYAYSGENKRCINDFKLIQRVPFMWVFCDSKGDRDFDSAKLYPVVGIDLNGGPIITKYPFSYWQDLNEDGKVEAEEMLFDPMMDGLNGNEKTLEEEIGI
ncbi:MAG: hypothetical protein AABX88_00450 [Nanoarchaeota archaeon]